MVGTLFQTDFLWEVICGFIQVGPLLNIVSFIFFERENTLSKKQPLLAIIPTIIYAIFAIILNLLKVIDGPYFFLKIYEQPIWEVIMWLVIIGILVFIIAFLLKKLHLIKNNFNKKFS